MSKDVPFFLQAYIVRCEDYQSQVFNTLQSAERFRSLIDPRFCEHPHDVVEIVWQDGRWQDAE